jgi:hypothetical protein
MTTPVDHPTSAMRGGFGAIVRPLAADRRFLAVAVVLFIAAVGLNATVQTLQLHFKKMPVPMRQEFTKALPAIAGDWVQVARDETLDPEMLSALGTDQFLFCSYVNAAKFNRTPEDLRRELVEGKTVQEQRKAMQPYWSKDPAAVVQFTLTYYTGKSDTVAHVAERCYVGSGFDPVESGTQFWDLNRGLSVRAILFKKGSDHQSVAYTFHANGHYEADSLKVRTALQDLFQRHGYYAKIEMSCPTPSQDAAAESMKSLLASVLPHVELALPDWEQYRSRK